MIPGFRLTVPAAPVLLLTALLCSAPLEAQDTRAWTAFGRVGVMLPLSSFSNDAVESAELAPTVSVGMALERRAVAGIGYRLGAELAPLTRSRVRLTAEECASFGGACAADGPGGVVAHGFGTLLFGGERYRVGIGAGARAYGSAASECVLIDAACLRAEDFPANRLGAALHVMASARRPLLGRTVVAELADYVSREAGRAQHELVLSVGLGW